MGFKAWRNGIMLIVLAGLCLAADAPGVSVTVRHISERRVAVLDKTEGYTAGFGSVSVRLLVAGPEVVDARKVGLLRVTKAVDDTDADLLVTPRGASIHYPEQYIEVRNTAVYQAKDKTKPIGFEVEVLLPRQPARSAKEIKLVEGDFQVLVGGAKKVISVKLKDQVGKPVDDADLKALGITFTPKEPGKPGPYGQVLPVDVHGDLRLVEEVWIENGKGDRISGGTISSGTAAGPKSFSYSLDEPADADTVLKIAIYAGQKQVSVPFKFENLKLP